MKGFLLIFCSLLIAFGATAQSKLGSQTPKKSIFITSILLVLMILVSCSVGYKNDGKEVTWNTWNEGSGYTSSHVDADPKTFEILNDDYGRDKKHAFYEGDIIMVPMAARSVCLPNRMQQTIRMYMFPVN